MLQECHGYQQNISLVNAGMKCLFAFLWLHSPLQERDPLMIQGTVIQTSLSHYCSCVVSYLFGIQQILQHD